MPFSVAQQKALALVPKFSGTLSILGSSCIIRSVLVDMKRGEASTYKRLLLAMSVFDVVGSFAQALSTWPIPRGTPGVWGAVGNTQACAFQGFILHMVGAGPVYNACISVYFLLKTRYSWNDERLRKAEPFMHGIPVINTFVTAFAALGLKLFNNANLWCWIAPFPLNCKDSLRYGDEGNCVRGDNAWLYRLVLQYFQVWISIFISIVSITLIYSFVLGREKAVDRVQEERIKIRRQSKRVAHQALSYVAAFYLAWGAPSAVRFIQAIPGNNLKVGFPLVLFVAVTGPMQGVFNSIIFFRARFLLYRRDFPGASTLKAVRITLWYSMRPHTKRAKKTQMESPTSEEYTDENHTEGRIVTSDVICADN